MCINIEMMKKMEKERPVFWQAVGLAWQFDYTVTVPLVVLVLAGRFLDKN